MNRCVSLLRILLASALLLTSCRSPVPVWNADGKSMTDLRTLRLRSGKSVELTRGVILYADEIHFTDKRKRSGEAKGHVFLDVLPAVRYEWMLEHGYAGKATFDKRNAFVILAEEPMLEREKMTIIATEPYTTIRVSWDSFLAQVDVHGPTRTDFSKSHPLPAGVVFPKAKRISAPVSRLHGPLGLGKR